MKKILFTSLFIALFIEASSQFSTSIESIREEFHLLSKNADRIIQPYDSLINRKYLLSKQLDREIAIYKECKTAFDNTAEELLRSGSRSERRKMNTYRDLQLEREELINKDALTHMSFNNWNHGQTIRLDKIYTEAESNHSMIQGLEKDLFKYVKKINCLQKESDSLFSRYEECMRECIKDCNCEDYYVKYEKVMGLTDHYRLEYDELKNERIEIHKNRKEIFENYMLEYRAYYNEFQERKMQMEESKENTKAEIKRIEEEIDQLEPEIYSMIFAAMERDIIEFNKHLYAEIESIDERIKREFGSIEYYKRLKDMRRMADIMVTTLNPEIDFITILDDIVQQENDQEILGDDGSSLKEISMNYGNILDELKTAIRDYDAIPYFVMHAYPQYSTRKVDENLKIIDRRLSLNNESLEKKTKKFLSVSELDLSNTNFSMDLLFKGHYNIEKLNLSNTEVSSIKYLTETNIRWLDLSNTKIDREDLEYIKQMRNIEYLDLSNTGLNKKDIHAVCYQLKIRRRNCKAE